jgi:hypothetical protein
MSRGLLRQSVFGRRAGYEDVNDADRLRRDPTMRWVVGDRAITGSAVSAPDGPLRSSPPGASMALGGRRPRDHGLCRLGARWAASLVAPGPIVLRSAQAAPAHRRCRLSQWRRRARSACASSARGRRADSARPRGSRRAVRATGAERAGAAGRRQGHRSREGAVSAEKLRHVGLGRRQGIEMV